MVDNGEPVLVLPFQVLPPDDADALPLQFCGVCRIVGPVFVENPGDTFL